MALGIVNMPVDAVSVSLLADVTNASAVAENKKITITWEDPEDLEYDGAIIAKWQGTLLLRKEGSAPENRFDGDIVVDSTEHNQYSSTGYVDTGLTNGTVYYYRFFPYDKVGTYRPGTKLSAQPAPNTVDLPIVTGDFTYNGEEKTPTLTYDSEAIAATGDLTSTDVGTKTITFTLKSDDYVWSDGSYTAKQRTWVISPERVTKPTIKAGQASLTYNSNFQSPELNNFDSTKMEQGGQASRMTVGNYTMTMTLTSTNYIWEGEDASIREIQLQWEIIKADGAITLSGTSGTVAYGNSITFSITGNTSNGTLSVEVANEDSNYVTAELTGSTVTVTCTNFRTTNVAVVVTSASTSNYNSATATYSVSLTKAAGSLSLSSNSVTVTADTPTAIVTATRLGDGVISAISNDTTTATVSAVNQSTGQFTITGVKTGNVTITVSVLAGSNHYAPADATIAVSCNFLPAKQAFNDTSWADIATIVKAGKASDYWNVGDTKDMQFSAAVTLDSSTIPANTTYKVVILGFDHNSVKEGTNRLHLCIGKNSDGSKDICFVGHNMNSSDANNGGWNSCAMKTWLNGTFYNALPADLKNVITECTKYTNNVGNYSDTPAHVSYTNQKIWLLAEFEVFGARTYANRYEQNSQQQYSYYQNGNSKIRYEHGSQGSADDWWLRSPYYDGGYTFCGVNDYGNASKNSAARYTLGVVPCFTIS